ncbi:hypothetical protein J6590_070865 [Homalodisca vitripennis]|nr:hypothetical protein J6590_070865 [Homalodisca vitripennis]
MSGISILGVPAEVYFRGAIYSVANIALLIVIPVTVHLFLPVFFKVASMSVYEYLELRFGRHLRVLASLAYPVQSVLFMAVVLYAPALALETLSGLSTTWSILVVGSVCTFYSTVGGIKAVIMTDVFQSKNDSRRKVNKRKNQLWDVVQGAWYYNILKVLNPKGGPKRREGIKSPFLQLWGFCKKLGVNLFFVLSDVGSRVFSCCHVLFTSCLLSVVYCVVICWWSTFTLLKCNQPPELPTAVAYPQGQAKLTDITKLTNYTTGYEDFYNALLQWPTTDAEMIERSNEDDDGISTLMIKIDIHDFEYHVQQLSEDDYDRRVEFCELVMRKCDDNRDFLTNILFSDEATFFLNGNVNRHNCRYWASENPHWITESHSQQPQKLNQDGAPPHYGRQFILTNLAVLTIILTVYLEKGSFINIWTAAKEGGRLNFSNFSLDPTERHTWWSLIIGATFTYMGTYAVHQSQVQRYLTLRDHRTALRTLYVSWPITTAFSLSMIFAGLCIYSKYQGCDPLM